MVHAMTGERADGAVGRNPETTADDDDVLRRIAAGDVTKVALLYDRYVARLLRVATRILGTRAEGEDAVHDAFLHLTQRAAMYRPEMGTVVAR